jgi:hypothetical protein
MLSLDNNGIVKCSRCGNFFISEEYNSHSCRQIVIEMFDTDGNRWGSYDKITYFSLPPFKKISDDSRQPKDSETTDDKYTEPYFRFCNVKGSFYPCNRLAHRVN